MVYSVFDVVRVPFPFTDRTASRRRPAVVLSDDAVFNTPAGHSVLAMVTSAKHARWPLDTVLVDLDAAGLPAASVVRCKLFTLDHRLIIDRLGRLSPGDVNRVSQNLQRLFPWCARGGWAGVQAGRDRAAGEGVFDRRGAVEGDGEGAS